MVQVTKFCDKDVIVMFSGLNWNEVLSLGLEWVGDKTEGLKE